MKRVKLIALLLTVTMLASMLTACGKDDGGNQGGSGNQTNQGNQGGDNQGGAVEVARDPITLTIFVAGPGEAPPNDNKIIQKIAELTGVTLDFEFLVGDMEQKVGIMIASGDYPDIIAPGQARGQFLNANAYAALCDYLPNFPNLWKHFGPYEQRLRTVAEDGKIYILDIWGRRYNLGDGQDDLYLAGYGGPAFWIQKDVLAWDGYSNPTTFAEYFDLLERYKEAHPTIDGQPTLAFEILCDDWRSFCLKNASQHIIGGRNEGDLVVFPDLSVEIYQNKWYARDYYKILNDAFHRGLIDPETFTRSFDQYKANMSNGRVLAMFDQAWNFGEAEDVLRGDGKHNRRYVPLGLTFDGPAAPYSRQREAGIIGGNGIGLSNGPNLQRALDFMDLILSEEIQILMTWGIEGEDYYVDENGRFRRTPEQKLNFDNPDWVLFNGGKPVREHFPKIEGRFSCGNAAEPNDQPEERLENMVEYDRHFLSQYGFSDRADFLPMFEFAFNYPEVWSMFSTMPEDNIAKIIFNDITDLQNRHLPGIIMSNNFMADWETYIARYDALDIAALESEMEFQIRERLYDPTKLQFRD